VIFNFNFYGHSLIRTQERTVSPGREVKSVPE